jgi:hypothetical protein
MAIVTITEAGHVALAGVTAANALRIADQMCGVLGHLLAMAQQPGTPAQGAAVDLAELEKLVRRVASEHGG